MEELSDAQLIAKYWEGDEKSLEILIKKYLNPVYNFTYRYIGNDTDAEDVTQEVFIRVWKHLEKFDDEKSFKTWIFSIARNAALDFLKKKKVISFSDLENEDEEGTILDTIADNEPLPLEILEEADKKQIIQSALEKLSLKYRIVISLYHENDLNFREIGESLDESIDTVKSRYRRGLIKLKEILEKEEI